MTFHCKFGTENTEDWHKMTPRWVGPCTVAEHVGSLGYSQDLPDTMLVHDLFHACYLRSYKGDY